MPFVGTVWREDWNHDRAFSVSARSKRAWMRGFRFSGVILEGVGDGVMGGKLMDGKGCGCFWRVSCGDLRGQSTY